jgi:hypothetical protein
VFLFYLLSKLAGELAKVAIGLVQHKVAVGSRGQAVHRKRCW